LPSGEPRLLRKHQDGKVIEGAPYPSGMWSCHPKVDIRRGCMHLAWLLDQLEPKRERSCKLIRNGAAVDLYCFSSAHQGLNHNPSRHSRSCTIDRIDIDIDHYGFISGKTVEVGIVEMRRNPNGLPLPPINGPVTWQQ